MSDATIAAVSNGGSPQPVKEQAPTASVQDADSIASEMLDNEDSGDSSAIDAAQKAGEISKKEAEALKKKIKIKVDGEESEEELSWDDEEGLKRHLQKSKAFDKRVKHFSDYEKKVQTLLSRLQDDPESLLEEMGYDVDGLAEKRLSKKVEQLKKTPDQIEKEKMQKELTDLKKKLAEEEKTKRQQEMESQRNQQAAAIQDEIMSALDGAKSKLPKDNPRVVEMIGKTMYFAMKNGYPNVKAKDVIPLVERQYKEEIKRIFDSSAEDVMEEYAGKENLARWRKKYLSSIRQTAKTETPKQMVQDTGSTSKKQEQEKPKKSFKKLFSYHDE